MDKQRKHPDAAMAQRLLTTGDLATRYNTAESTVRYWRHVGSGPQGFRVGRRVLYRPDEVERWEREQEEAEISRAAAGR